MSQLTVTQVVVQQMGLSKKSVIDWYVFCREVCEAIVSNEMQGKIGGEGTSMDESHLFIHKYGVGRIRKCENMVIGMLLQGNEAM